MTRHLATPTGGPGRTGVIRAGLATAGFTTVRTVGSALTPDVLAAVVTGTDLPGMGSDAYELELGLTPKEAANRAWAVLTGAWSGYRQRLDATPAPALALTREKWLTILLRELGFGRVPATPAGGIRADGESWPVSHLASGDIPVHLLGWHVDLDRPTPGLAGAARKAPHAMVQELLNRSDDHLWAILASGDRLRLLRDSTSIVGPSYVEFDLEAMFGDQDGEGGVFSDFAVLWLLCHQSRFQPLDADIGQASCWLERWRTHAAEVGTRALGALRLGVKAAIEALGSGLLAHPANTELRAKLDDDRIDDADLQRALLRLVYRLLLCFVAEDREVLLDPAATKDARARYTDWYSTARLRRLATRRHGDAHTDLWQALTLILEGLGKEGGVPALALPGLGGIFEDGPADVAAGSAIPNRYLLDAVRHLSLITPAGSSRRRLVDYRNLGAEELGGIYESLLEYVPSHDLAGRTFTLTTLAGNDRKKTGAYYTPTSLTEALLDTALEPLLTRAAAAADPEAALLGLTVCDPACGSGHFLVAAARRIANRLAEHRADGAQPSEEGVHSAMHDVVARCVYGVDVNPMAAELAKVSLWLEGMTAGAALSLLDSRIKVGNALLGATPALLADGIPDDAYKPIEGDTKTTAAALKKRNKQERSGQGSLLGAAGLAVTPADLAARMAAIDALPTRRLADVHVAARRWRDLDASPELARARLAADAWCAAFVLPKTPGAPELTQSNLLRLAHTAAEQWTDADRDLVGAVNVVRDQYRFFHWHLEYPHIFAGDGPLDPTTGWAGGFDLVIGNPPWERVKLQEQEWFAARRPEIAEAPNAAARKRLIVALEAEHSDLHAEFLLARRQAEGESHYIRSSGRYPLCGRGDVNTYAIFAEADRSLLAPTGRLGVILPTGIATDATTQYFFKDLVVNRSLASLYGFYDRKKIFKEADVHGFCLLIVDGRSTRNERFDFTFFLRTLDDLRRDEAHFTLTPEEINLLNPNTGTCPVFRSRRDAELTLAIYRRHPVLVRKGDPDGNPWGVTFMRMIDMSNDSHLFRTGDDLERAGWTAQGNRWVRGDDEMLPLYEAKMIHHYDHRWATYTDDGDVRDATLEEHQDPDFTVRPRYWVHGREVDGALLGQWEEDWLCGFRNVCRSTDERTLICGMLPKSAVGNSMPTILLRRSSMLLVVTMSSLVADFALRQKLGGTNLNFFYIEQLPIPLPETFADKCPWDLDRRLQDWIEDRVDELIYTADDMAPAAASLGDDGKPFVWDPARRAVLRAELDAAFFHIYGIDSREDVAYILSTFPIVNRRDPELAGRVLDAYDALATAAETGVAYVSPLDPPPGDGPRHESTHVGLGAD